jgi:iron complex transport system substrate-binding protein
MGRMKTKIEYLTKNLIFLVLFFCCSIDVWGATPTSRYVSLAPATTEILFALGLEKEIVGVSSFCNYPPAAKQKENVGSFSAPNIENILGLRPDIIFCTGMEQTPSVLELRHLNFKVYVSSPATLQELFESIVEMGTLTHKEKEAKDLVAEMKADLEALKRSVSQLSDYKRLKIFIEIWGEPLITAGRGSFIDELISFLGGINIASDVPRSFCYFNSEQVILRNPDCIILAYMSKDAPEVLMQRRFGWKSISAVKNGRVYNDINPDLILRPGPRIVQGARELSKRMYSS